jgi:outer membrane protein OmpA-like peptidoglycan-associated protein
MNKNTLIVLIAALSGHSLANAERSIYCNNNDYELQHSVSVSDVNGIGVHRQGFLMITQQAEDDQLAAQLAKQATPAMVLADCKSLITNQSNGLQNTNLMARLHFAFDQYNLTPLAKSALQSAVKKQSERGANLSVEGHTDSVGTEEYNQALGLKRALSVHELLVTQGIDKNKVTVRTYGETKPLKPNNTAENRALNRRAEVFVLTSEQSVSTNP